MKRLWQRFLDLLLGPKCPKHGNRQTPYPLHLSPRCCPSCADEEWAEAIREHDRKKREAEVRKIADGIKLALTDPDVIEHWGLLLRQLEDAK